jgi:hypothetical protein
MKKRLFLHIFIGIILILTPFAVVKYWPYAQSPYMPAELQDYDYGYFLARTDRLASWDDPRLKRVDGEADLEFANRMLNIVHDSTYHCEAYDYRQSWFTWLTWKLGIYSIIPGNTQGVLDLKTFRCGFCHQRAFILAKVLRDRGIKSAEVLGINGHVITVFKDNNELYSVDPDFGVGPVNISGLDSGENISDEILNKNELRNGLWNTYSPLIGSHSQSLIDSVLDFYLSNEDNQYYNYNNLERLRTAQSIMFFFEKVIEASFIICGFIVIGVSLFERKKVQ